MFQRISSLILLFCLTAALLPHGNAAAANQKPEYFANSDVEAYVEEYLYGMDEEQGNRLYRESRGALRQGVPHRSVCAANLLRRAEALRTYPGIRANLSSPIWTWRPGNGTG